MQMNKIIDFGQSAHITVFSSTLAYKKNSHFVVKEGYNKLMRSVFILLLLLKE